MFLGGYWVLVASRFVQVSSLTATMIVTFHRNPIQAETSDLNLAVVDLHRSLICKVLVQVTKATLEYISHFVIHC